MSEIEWKQIKKLPYMYEGYFNGHKVCHYNSIHKNLMFVMSGYHNYTCDTLEIAEPKAEELLADWLQKANLVPTDQIYFCDKCGDSGNIKVRIGEQPKGAAHTDSCYATKNCPCREKPYSIVSLRREK